MDLSHEDSLRLNVLMTQGLHAIRIDESSMTVHALTTRGEAKVSLNPNCRDENYLRLVKEMFSMHALGSPGGYPVYLKRWTRMGQMKEESLRGLLLLGEPEAIIAVAHSPDLDEEVGRYAWWAMPSTDVGRQMLKNMNIINTSLGREIANFLVEFLPFEVHAKHVVQTVSLILQPGLVDVDTVASLWSRASRKGAYYVGFLLADVNQIPEQRSANNQLESVNSTVSSLLESNSYAFQLNKLLTPDGQNFLHTLSLAINKLSDQDIVVLCLNAIENYFTIIRPDSRYCYADINELMNDVSSSIEDPANQTLQELTQALPNDLDSIKAMLALSRVNESLINPIFSQTDAVGTVMRKRIKPITECIGKQIEILLA